MLLFEPFYHRGLSPYDIGVTLPLNVPVATGSFRKDNWSETLGKRIFVTKSFIKREREGDVSENRA